MLTYFKGTTQMGDMKSGDVVMVQSGGPKMTVERVVKGVVSCVWFEGPDLFRGTFPVDALKLIPY
jgi:uncharacterized protein YodC (DUF2158 family)